MSLQQVLNGLGITQVEFARAVQLPKSSVSVLLKSGEWPVRKAGDLKRRTAAFLVKAGAGPQQLALMHEAGLFPSDAQEPATPTTADAIPATAATTTHTEEDLTMLLENIPLTPQARQHFNLPRSPFVDEINTRADVWASANMRYVRAALMDAALNHGFIAVIGESGSGKTTLREELEERIREENRPIKLIKPYVLDMEPSDTKGKMMKSGRIAEAIGHALAPTMLLKSSPEARFRQIHDLLRESCIAGCKHLLVIEEAHRLPLATLKHLKGFMELKDGLRRLLGVCLIGQPELHNVLSEHRPDIREIVQRCEKVRMEPIDNELEAYLKHKFERVGVKLGDVFADDAFDALRARLIHVPRGGKAADAMSICYPLAINNRVARALNAAARAGWPRVDAQVIANC